MNEQAFVSLVYERLVQHKGIKVGLEVPLLGRSVDLVMMLDGVVISVEFKLRDWRRALIQAKDHRLGADYSYICVPPERVTETLIDAVHSQGVGLLTLSRSNEWPLEVVVKAPPSTDTWPDAKEMVIEHLSSSKGTKRVPKELAYA